ncbi:hypothetical protein LOK49_LG14G00353 [Camellia lanceoleosa]|uniref:Uncharacterized protein n=1 Tax=Camellia lanceoleosa TaxID=1840588 RepID=A0ACC0FCS5_9ERIC|nr:hypothetical protein LOK49_LG14G00353 [Camellia lanceoleosa]
MATKKAVTPQSSPACSRKRPGLGCLAAMYLATRREANAKTPLRDTAIGRVSRGGGGAWASDSEGKAAAPPQPEGVDQLFQTVSFPTISQMHTK